MRHKTNWWNSVLTKSEKKNLINAFDNKKLSMGEISHKFEKDFSNLTSSKYSLATTSGTMALYLALKSLGIKKMMKFWCQHLHVFQLQMLL